MEKAKAQSKVVLGIYVWGLSCPPSHPTGSSHKPLTGPQRVNSLCQCISLPECFLVVKEDGGRLGLLNGLHTGFSDRVVVDVVMVAVTIGACITVCAESEPSPVWVLLFDANRKGNTKGGCPDSVPTPRSCAPARLLRRRKGNGVPGACRCRFSCCGHLCWSYYNLSSPR